MMGLYALFLRDIRLFWRGNESGLAVCFFFLLVTLFSFGIGGDLKILRELSSGMVWVCLILAVFLSLESVFRVDIETGCLDQFILSPYPLELLVLMKALAHWVSVILPLILFAPLGGILLNLSTNMILPLWCILLLSTPAMSFLGLIGSAITAQLPRGGLLLIFLVMPLYIPVLIFGVIAIGHAIDQQSYSMELLILFLWSLITASVSPLIVSFALRGGFR